LASLKNPKNTVKKYVYNGIQHQSPILSDLYFFYYKFDFLY